MRRIMEKVFVLSAVTGGRYALATMCIGGGQGIAAIFERV
jgi:acetyl-CoA acetyltransferase